MLVASTWATVFVKKSIPDFFRIFDYGDFRPLWGNLLGSYGHVQCQQKHHIKMGLWKVGLP